MAEINQAGDLAENECLRDDGEASYEEGDAHGDDGYKVIWLHSLQGADLERSSVGSET